MEKIITIRGQQYTTLPEVEKHSCKGCVFQDDSPRCGEVGGWWCGGNDVIFGGYETKSVTIPFNLELDFSSCILPDFFKVKSLKVPTLDEALLKGTDSFLLSAKNLTQEQVLEVAEGLKREFIKRNSKGLNV